MKVLVAVLLVIGSVAARGSGPYLPSGWRPDGPAFYLPSEVSKPVAKPEPIVIEETEASGSDALREYGPPKLEVLIDVNQGLPDVATEQTFLRASINENVVEAAEEANVEENSEQVVANLEESATESQTAEAVIAVEQEAAAISEVDSTGSPASDVVEQKEESSDIVQAKEKEQKEYVPVVTIPEEIVVPTAAVEEVAVPLFQQALEQEAVPTPVSEIVVVEQEIAAEALPTQAAEALPTQAADSVAAVSVVEEEVSQEVAPTPAEEVVEKVAEGISNIAESIISLEKEVKAIEVQAEVNADIKSSQDASGALEQAPEGFLEYGPPGFLEYGPPKDLAIAGLAAEVASSAAVENNEVRRRRFSPKFRSTKKH